MNNMNKAFALFCATVAMSVPMTSLAVTYTQQPIEKAVGLREGMSETEVISVLGMPVIRDFQGKGATLQWCRTGYLDSSFPLDRYVIGFFYENKLVGIRNYQGGKGDRGDCSILYRQIEWTPSDRVINYKFKPK